MTWSPSEPRLPPGMPQGGQWGTVSAVKPSGKSGAKASSAKKKTTGSAKAVHGTKPGVARSAAATALQKNPAAQKLYAQLMGTTGRDGYVGKLSTADLKLLTQIVYSSKTSDPNVVHARIAVANEMTRRGIPIQSYGALGGGISPGRAATVKKVAAAKATRKH